MKKYILLSFFSFFLASCATNSVFQVSKAGNEPEESKERVVYTLPQTLFLLSVEFEKETYIPGPFRLFTEKYLGLEDYITESGFNYRLLNVDLESFEEPDPDHFYSLNLIKGDFNWDKFLKLSDFGLIFDPSSEYSRKYDQERKMGSHETSFFTDRSVKRNLRVVTDTLYKTVINDSSYVRVPVLRSHREAKTLEQKAEEAANFIIKIRKRRFKLLAGQYDVFPEGRALEISVSELDKLEKEYMELFLGKRIKEKYTKSFIVIPGSGIELQKHTFAGFSSQHGLLKPDNNSGRPLELILEPQGKLMNLPAIQSITSGIPGNNTLLYRIPDIVEIKVKLVDEILYEGRKSVYQLGRIVSYPIDAE